MVILFFFLLYSHDALPRSNPSAFSWLREAGVACALKSWWKNESNFLPVEKRGLFEADDKLPKTSQRDAALGFLTALTEKEHHNY